MDGLKHEIAGLGVVTRPHKMTVPEMTVPELTVPEFSVGILRARIPIAGADPTTADHALHDPTKIDEEVYLLIPHSPLPYKRYFGFSYTVNIVDLESV